MSKLVGGNMMIKGYFARIMYMSLYKMHLMALHGSAKVALEAFSRSLTHIAENRA